MTIEVMENLSSHSDSMRVSKGGSAEDIPLLYASNPTASWQ